MDYKCISQNGSDMILEDVRRFDLDETLDCGQSFRWIKDADSSYSGIACGKFLKISRSGNNVVFHNVTPSELENIWLDYFDLHRDYGEIADILSHDGVLEKAIGFAGGIRVLRQEPWEALCTFILSQNNNIPRIKGLVERLCLSFGDELEGGYAFPPPEYLAGLTVEDLAPVRAGFRAKYILDAAKKVASGEIELTPLYKASLSDARMILQKIHGVGPKVAECALLYGFGRVECFPVDVWIKRVLDSYYPGGFPEEFAPWAGIAQQYLFHYIRSALKAVSIAPPG